MISGRLLLAYLLLSWISPASAEETRRAGRTIPVALGKEFRLGLGESARLPGRRASLRITGFVNSPCPKGAQCGWSGLAVNFELLVDGKAARLDLGDAPYQVDVKSSDYRSYAVFVVDKPELACSRLDPPQGAECLRHLAVRRESAALCRSIADARTRGICLEDVAERRLEPGLCGEVPSPSQYCLYVRAKEKGELESCDGIILFQWRVKCFKELTSTGKRSCADLAPDLAARCREYIADP